MFIKYDSYILSILRYYNQADLDKNNNLVKSNSYNWLKV